MDKDDIRLEIQELLIMLSELLELNDNSGLVLNDLLHIRERLLRCKWEYINV